MPTRKIEEYIETIFFLQQKHERAYTKEIADVMGIRAPSAYRCL